MRASNAILIARGTNSSDCSELARPNPPTGTQRKCVDVICVSNGRVASVITLFTTTLLLPQRKMPDSAPLRTS